MEYGINAIHYEKNFADKKDLEILNAYMNDLPDPGFKSINLISSIEDDTVKETMQSLDKKIQNFVKETYFPKIGFSVKTFIWYRELELIKWSKYAVLPAHIDGEDNIMEYPSITIGGLVYLNDEYLGGEIFFPEYNISIKPNPGDLVIFPCHYLHEVKVILPIEDKITRRHTFPVFYTLMIEKNDN